MMNRRSFLKVLLAAICAPFVKAQPKDECSKFAKFEIQDSEGTWKQIPIESLSTVGFSYDEQGGFDCPPEIYAKLKKLWDAGISIEIRMGEAWDLYIQDEYNAIMNGTGDGEPIGLLSSEDVTEDDF